MSNMLVLQMRKTPGSGVDFSGVMGHMGAKPELRLWISPVLSNSHVRTAF